MHPKNTSIVIFGQNNAFRLILKPTIRGQSNGSPLQVRLYIQSVVLIGQRCFAATMNHEEFRRLVLMVQLDRVEVDDVVNPMLFRI